MGSAPITLAPTTSDAGPIIPWDGPPGSHQQDSGRGGGGVAGSARPQRCVSPAQICVGVARSKDADGFIRVSSGKKRGLVPADALTEI